MPQFEVVNRYGAVPDGWDVKALANVSRNWDRLRKPLSKKERSKRPGPYPYYGAAKVFDFIDDFIFDGEYLLLAEDGSVVKSDGTPFLQLTGGKFWANNHTHILEGANGVSTRYLYYYLSGFDISGYVTGAAQPKITQGNMNRIPVLVPPSPIRKAITHLLSAYDDLIENNRRRIRILEEMAQLVYREWFVHYRFPGHEEVTMVDSPVGAVPKNWEVTTMQDVADVVDCLHSKKPEFDPDGSGLLVQLNNIGSTGTYDPRVRFTISEEDYKRWTARIEVRGGDCVITNVGRVGAVAQIPEGLHAAIGRNMTAVRPGPRLTPTYLIEYLRSPHMERETALKKDAGTIMDSLNVRGIYQLNVPLPPASLMESFDAMARPMRELIETLTWRNVTLGQIRDLLLPRLISGDLDVADLEIERGAVLA